MNEFADRIAALPPARRQLLERLLQQQPQAHRRAAYVAPRTPAERTLADIWAAVLGVERVGIHDSFFELGGDSIQSIQIIAKARRAGLHLTNTELFRHPTIASLATGISAAPPADVEPAAAQAGDVPLAPIQHWFFECAPRNVHHWNQAVLLDTTWTSADEPALRQACRALVGQHDALRARFHREDDRWRQVLMDVARARANGLTFATVDLRDIPAAQQPSSVSAVIADAHRSLDITGGPLTRVLFLRLPEGHHQVLLVAHHLITDAVSFRLLLDDLRFEWQRHTRDGASAAAPPPMSWTTWCRQTARGGAAPHSSELELWRTQLDCAFPLPRDCPTGRNLERDARQVICTWDTSETARLRAVHDAGSATIQHRLLAALYLTLATWTRDRRVAIWLEAHGRDDQTHDLSRTVGWFTSLFPVLLQSADGVFAPGFAPDAPPDPAHATRVLRDIRRALDAIPDGGRGYGRLRYLTVDADVRRALGEHTPETLFNYFGVLDEGTTDAPNELRVAEALAGDPYDPDGERPYVLQVYGGIAGGRLTLSWSYSNRLHRRETIDDLVQRFRASLGVLAAPGTEAPADPASMEDVRIDPLITDTDLRAILASQDVE